MVNIILNLVLIPYFGIAGAAVATTISFLLISFLILFYTVKKAGVVVDFRWFTRIGFLAFVCVLFYSLLREVKINSYVAGGVVITVLILIIWARFLSKEDRAYFLDLVKTCLFTFFKLIC